MVSKLAVAGYCGRHFESWDEILQSRNAATGYWNQHRHPFPWGRRPRRINLDENMELQKLLVLGDLPDEPLSMKIAAAVALQ